MLRCTGQCGEENQGTALHGSGHLLVDAVLAVGKAVWNTIVLLKLSGPAEPHNNPLFFKPSHKVRLLHWQFPLRYAIRTLKNVLFFLYDFLKMFFFSLVVLLFWSKMVCVAICRLELNAADWNLNCDLAVANCESAAELPIKPLSSSHSRFSFVSWFISLYHFVCLGFFYFILFFSKVQISLLLSYRMFWRYFSVQRTSFYFFPPNMDISVSIHVTCYSFKGLVKFWFI